MTEALHETWIIQFVLACSFYKFVSLTIGTYGTVFKAKNKESQEIVALKRVRLDDDDEVCYFLLFITIATQAM